MLSVSIKYSVRDLICESLTMPGPQISNMRDIRQMMSALPLASGRLIPFLNHLLDADLCKKKF